MIKLGISCDGFAPCDEALTFGKEAAAPGAQSPWMAGHLGYREPIVSCLGFANAIPGRVVPTAVSRYLRQPMPTAGRMATPAIGTGNPVFLGESNGTIEKPVAVAREFISALRTLWSGEPGA